MDGSILPKEIEVVVGALSYIDLTGYNQRKLSSNGRH